MTDSTPPTSGPSTPSCAPCGPWWRLPLLLALVLAAMVLARSRADRDATPESERALQTPRNSSSAGAAENRSTADAANATVSLVIDFGDGRTRQFSQMAWHDGMTVERLLAAARALPDGITFAQQGSGSSALLTEIDGVAGQGGAGRNWAFFVNDRRADRGFGVYVLRPGDCVLWKFIPTQ